ncbi:hypothetical protein ACN22W_20085 [Burkholderia theae]|uniref:hypothetical protein n=1 Tax=Burkholderia theae TaxID=3143496 RepID=UPI003AFA5491
MHNDDQQAINREVAEALNDITTRMHHAAGEKYAVNSLLAIFALLHRDNPAFVKLARECSSPAAMQGEGASEETIAAYYGTLKSILPPSCYAGE